MYCLILYLFCILPGTVGWAQSSNLLKTQSADGAQDTRPSALNMESPYRGTVTSRFGIRPPKPKNLHEEFRFPEGFLSPSDENKDKSEEKNVSENPPKKEPEKPEVIPPQVSAKEPDVSQTASSPLLPDDNEPNHELLVKDRSLVYVALVAILALGVFMISDYRYRCRLQNIVSLNRQLLAPGAVSTDFELVGKDSYTDPLGGLFSSLFYNQTPPGYNFSNTNWNDDSEETNSIITNPGPIPDSVPPIKNDEFYV